MSIGFLATGDEITTGDTLNTNTQQLAKLVHSEGLEPGMHLACDDDEKRICQSIAFLAKRYAILIIIGGLGPTSDDRTRFALSRFLHLPLIEFPEAINHIKQRLRATSLSPGNRQQAQFPPGALLLPNPNGTALGCLYQHKQQIFILLPGPPRECLPMFKDHVLKHLCQLKHSDKILLKWRVFGVAEGVIAEEIDQALEKIDCETGFRLETPYVECKVRCHAALKEKIISLIHPIVTPHIIAPPEKKASEQLLEALISWQQPLSIIDEATGGHLQRLLDKPSTHHLLSFHQKKPQEPNFHIRGLESYWSGQTPGCLTSLNTIFDYQGKMKEEVHQLPYRSELIVHYAAEWLSFRIFHLLNPLHQGIA